VACLEDINRQIERGIVFHKRARYHKHEQEHIRVSGTREEGGGGVFLICSLQATYYLQPSACRLGRLTLARAEYIWPWPDIPVTNSTVSKLQGG